MLANPPYIVPPTKLARDTYRRHYVSAHGKYGLGLPFTERLFELCVDGGFIAEITSNAFMKRDHGEVLVADVLPHYDLHLVVDTSGAYIPGHGTPTVILAARNRPPSGETVRVVQSRRGEPGVPTDHVGAVWSSILHALGAPPEHAPSGCNPVGLRWAKALSKVAAELARAVRDGAKLDKAEAGSIAAAWITGACALVAFQQRSHVYDGRVLRDDVHLAESFAEVARALPFGEWWNPSAGINPCFRWTIPEAWSERVRAEVARVVVTSEIPLEQRGSTDWIGDLYQGLDEAARDEHAFCQTPWWVARLLGWLALDPAVEAWGDAATVCDPACGTGHLLLEAFDRLHGRRASGEEDVAAAYARGTDSTAVLDRLYGADLNPVAAALCRWRLMLAWLDTSMPRRLSLVPDDLPIHVEVADALTAGREPVRIDHAKRWPAPAAPIADAPAAPPRGQLSLFGEVA